MESYPMPQCATCDQHISEQFQRVFSDATGEVYACPNCSANAGIGEVTRDRQTEPPNETAREERADE